MTKVTAYVYDITQGMAAQMSVPLLGKRIDIIPHTGIAAFGKEYFFGSGPCIGEPGKSVPVPVAQVLDLGETQKTVHELEVYIRDVLALEHNEQNYNLLSHNCNHYADAVAKFLLDGKGLPDSIVNVAEEALSSPQGQTIRVMIENMEKSMRSGSSGAGSAMNPFGNVGTAVPAAVPSRPSEPAVSGSEELEAALKELASNPVEERRAALGMLLKMTENVEKDPSEPKFRRIKMSNAAFTKKVGSAAGGVDAMVAAGWLPDVTPEGEDAWMMNDEAARQQGDIRKRLAAEVAKLPAAPAPVPASAPTPAPAAGGYTGPGLDALNGLGGPGGFGGMGAGNPALQQAMQNPAMMQQAQQMMQNPQAMAQMQQMMGGMGGGGNNAQMMAQAQQMMQNPEMMAQVQQMMQNPQAMAQMQQMMGGMGGGMGGGL